MTDEDLRERRTERHEAFAGSLLHLYVDTIEGPGGTNATREVVIHPGAVAVVATDDDGRILMVRQWRHAVDRALWEVPAGTREAGEEPDATAVRELEEETGYAAAEWRALGAVPLAPGYSTEVIHLYAASGLTAGASHPDEGENVVAELFTPPQVAGLIARGEVDMKTIAALALAGFSVTANA